MQHIPLLFCCLFQESWDLVLAHKLSWTPKKTSPNPKKKLFLTKTKSQSLYINNLSCSFTGLQAKKHPKLNQCQTSHLLPPSNPKTHKNTPGPTSDPKLPLLLPVFPSCWKTFLISRGSERTTVGSFRIVASWAVLMEHGSSGGFGPWGVL